MYYNDLAEQQFGIVMPPADNSQLSSGFDPYYSAAVNITAIPGYCDMPLNFNACSQCTSDYNFADCTLDVMINSCAPESPMFDSHRCDTAATTAGTSDADPPRMASGAQLLAQLGINQLDKYKCFSVLLQQGCVYLILATFFALSFYRDWSRRNVFTDLWYQLSEIKIKKLR